MVIHKSIHKRMSPLKNHEDRLKLFWTRNKTDKPNPLNQRMTHLSNRNSSGKENKQYNTHLENKLSKTGL